MEKTSNPGRLAKVLCETRNIQCPFLLSDILVQKIVSLVVRGRLLRFATIDRQKILGS